MKALVLVAHGSRRQASNEEVVKLSKVVAERLGSEFSIVGAGFLELTEPLIPEAIGASIKQGATEVYVMPYFLSAGRHVQEDVPEEVDKARHANPHIPITVLPYIGGVPQIADLVCDTVMGHAQ